MTTLVLIRHATTAATGKRLGGRTPAELDDAGRAQADALAERLADVPFKAVYASPLPRAMQTAAALAASRRIDVQPCEGLLELEFGDWTDRPLKSLARTKLWPAIQGVPSTVGFPDGETFRQAQLRAVDAVEELVDRHPRDAVAAVSHADVIKMVVAYYLGMPLDVFQRLHVAPASATVLALRRGAPAALLRFNDDGPLSADRFARPVPSGAAARARPRRGAARG
ncbi:MAG TPA: histidine phosphatase family protein [Egibacteraceae bacterium]|nr:histidine phosphatase family protein [Egibacteraceae bacterium]